MNELEKELDKQILEFGEFSEDSLDIEEKKLDLKELMNYSLFEPTEGWKVDHFNEEQKTTNLDVFNNKTIFSDYFLNQDYSCFSVCQSMNSFYLFTIFEDEDNKELLIMCSTESESKFKRIKKLDITYSIWRKLFSLGPKPQSLIKAFDLEFDGSMIKKCLQENEEKELLQMENLEIPRNYKFGVLYIKDQQKTQEEYITNVETSKEFQDFLDILGEPITLLGWKKYRGGLDVKHNASGETSIYTEWNDFSIMFHVLTILPYNEKDSQQVTRKKHIGNDVVVIVFIDGNTTFVPSSFKSKQNHIFIAVKPLKDDEIIKYQLEVSMRNCVPQYEPFLPLPPIIKKDELRDFLLTKACQGERIAQKSGKFFDRFVNFRRSLLEEIWERYQY